MAYNNMPEEGAQPPLSSDNNSQQPAFDIEAALSKARAGAYERLATRAANGDQEAESAIKAENSVLANTGKVATSFASGALRSTAGIPGYFANTADPSQIGSTDGALKGIQAALNRGADAVDEFGTSNSTMARDALARARSEKARAEGGEWGAFKQGLSNMAESPTIALEGVSSMAGTMVPQIAVQATVGRVNPLAGVAMGAAAFGAGSAGNIQEDKFKELMSMPEEKWLGNAAYAANPTPENKRTISQGIANSVGQRDMAINTTFGVFGPAKDIAGKLAGQAAAKKALAENGLANAGGGLLTNAIKPYVATKAMAKTVGLFGVQTVAATANQNEGTSQVDKDAKLTDNMGAALADALPAALLFGAKSGVDARSQKAGSQAKLDQLQERAREIFRDEEGLTKEQAAEQAVIRDLESTRLAMEEAGVKGAKPAYGAADAAAYVAEGIKGQEIPRASEIAAKKAEETAAAEAKAQEEAAAKTAAEEARVANSTETAAQKAMAEIDDMMTPDSERVAPGEKSVTDTLSEALSGKPEAVADPAAAPVADAAPAEAPARKNGYLANAVRVADMSPERQAKRAEMMPKIVDLMTRRGIELADKFKAELIAEGKDPKEIKYNHSEKNPDQKSVKMYLDAMLDRLGEREDGLAKGARHQLHKILAPYWHEISGSKESSAEKSVAKAKSRAEDARAKAEKEQKAEIQRQIQAEEKAGRVVEKAARKAEKEAWKPLEDAAKEQARLEQAEARKAAAEANAKAKAEADAIKKAEREAKKKTTEQKKADRKISAAKEQAERAAKKKALEESNRKAREEAEAQARQEADRMLNEESKVVHDGEIKTLTDAQKAKWMAAEQAKVDRIAELDGKGVKGPLRELALKAIEKKLKAERKEAVKEEIVKLDRAESSLELVKSEREALKKGEMEVSKGIKAQISQAAKPAIKKALDSTEAKRKAIASDFVAKKINEAERNERLKAEEMAYKANLRRLTDLMTDKEKAGANAAAKAVKPGDLVRAKDRKGNVHFGKVKTLDGKAVIIVDRKAVTVTKGSIEKAEVVDGKIQRFTPPFPDVAPDFNPLFRKLGDGITEVAESVPNETALSIRSMLSSFPIHKLGKRLLIADGVNEAFASDPRQLQQVRDGLGGAEASGLYDPSSKTVMLFADAIKTKVQAIKTLLHEVSHRGFDLLFNSADGPAFEALAMRLFNSNRHLRDITAGLIKSGALKDNSPVRTKLFEALAVATEMHSEHYANLSHRNAIVRVFAQTREFLHRVVSRVAGEELAKKFLGEMPDAELSRVLRMGLNAGFGKMEKLMGPRITAIDGDAVSTMPLFRSEGSEKVSQWLSEKAESRGVIGSIADAVSKAYDGITNSREAGFFERHFMTLNGRGQKRESVGRIFHALQKGDDFSRSMLRDLTNGLNAVAQREVAVNGSAAGALKGIPQAFKNNHPSKEVKAINEHLGSKVFSIVGADGAHAILSREAFIKNARESGMTEAMAEKSYATYDGINQVAKSANDMTMKAELQRVIRYLGGDGIPAIVAKSTPLETYQKAYKDALAARMGETQDKGRLKALERAVDAELAHHASMEGKTVMDEVNPGRYINSVYNKSGELVSSKRFESKQDAEQDLARLKRQHPEDQFDVKAETVSKENGRISADHLELVDAIDAKTRELGRIPTPEEVKALAVGQAELITRELAARQARRKTQGDLSSSKPVDAFRSLTQHILNKTNEASSKMHAFEKADAFAKIPKEEGATRDDMIKLLKQLAVGESAGLAKWRGFMYSNTLGFSVASAAMQKFQQFILAAPVMNMFVKGDFASQAKTFSAFAKAEFDVLRGGLTRLDGYRADGKHVEGSEAHAVAKAIELGIIAEHEAVSLSQQANNAIGAKIPAIGAILNAGSSFFATAEMGNRMATVLAAHRLIKSGAIAPETVAKFGGFNGFAQHVLNEAHFNTERFNKPGIARSEIGGLVMQFKMFPIMMMETLIRMPAKQRAQSMLALLAFAGIGGLPFAQNIMDAVDAVGEAVGEPIQSRAFIDKGLRDMGLGDTGTGVATRGIGRFAGLEIGTRVGIGDIIPMVHAFIPSNDRKKEDILNGFGISASYIGNLVGAVGDADKLGTAASPAFAKNLITGVKMAATGQATNAKGQMIKDYAGKPGDLAYDSISKALGIQPSSLAAYAEGKQIINRAEDSRKYFVSKMATKTAEAIAAQDPKAIAAAQEELREWNRKHMGTMLMINVKSFFETVRSKGRASALPEVEGKIRHAKGAEREMLIQLRDQLLK